MLDATTLFIATGFKELIVKKILIVLTHCRSGFNLVEIQTDLGSKRIVTIIIENHDFNLLEGDPDGNTKKTPPKPNGNTLKTI